MGRPVVLSNGQLFVGLDEQGLVHDFYYPYVGLDNLTNARSVMHKIGVWVDGEFSWTNDGSWQTEASFADDALVSDITMHNSRLQITLQFRDFVDTEYNALIRCSKITNEANHKRDIRLFMHQVFQIGRAGRADTALYVPDDHYILDYKGRVCLLVAGKIMDSSDGFDQFSIGNYNIEGKAGTFKDAEDGELSNNPVEHGGVDSVLRFRREVEAGEWFGVDYWIVAAESQSDAQVVHTHLKYYSLSERLEKVRTNWQQWLGSAPAWFADLPPKQREILQKSLLIIKAHCDSRGSVLASGDSSIFNFGRDYYCYCWPRDAAYAMWPLIRLKHFDAPKNFFAFAQDTLHRDGYLLHKYQPDRAVGSTWHPLIHNGRKELAIQEDETAIVLYMIGEYYKASQDAAYIKTMYDTFIVPTANFMTDYVDEATGLPHASYDLWEQKFLTSTYTVATVIAALRTAVSLAEVVGRADDSVGWKRAADHMQHSLDALYHPEGYFRKGFLLQPNGSLAYDDTLDASSFYGVYRFAGLPLDDPRLTSTFKHVESRLYNQSPIGGALRFEGDGYFLAKPQYKGNPWIVCTLWMAQYYHDTNHPAQAQEAIAWSLARAYPSGSMSEQFDPDTGFAASVTPLVWSHAAYIDTLLNLRNSK